MKNINDKTNENLVTENLEDVNGGVSAKQVLAAASLAVMGSNFAASSPIVRAEGGTQTTTTAIAPENEETAATPDSADNGSLKSDYTVKESVKGEKDKSYKEVYNAKKIFEVKVSEYIKSLEAEIEECQKKLEDTKDPQTQSYLEQLISWKKLSEECTKEYLKSLKELKNAISKDFDNDTIKYAQYNALRYALEKQGNKSYPYIRILKKSKNIDKCINSIYDLSIIEGLLPWMNDIRVVYYSGTAWVEALGSTNHDFLKKNSKTYSGDFDTNNFAVAGLKEKLEKRRDELISEEKNIGKKQIVEKLNKGKFIDATVELEKYLESSKSAPDRSLLDCLSQYVNAGGMLGCESIQRDLRNMTDMISKIETNGEILVNFDAETYRQLQDIIGKIKKIFENETLKEDKVVYRGTTRNGLKKMLDVVGVKLSREDFNDPEKIKNILIGKVFEDKAFQSTSIDKKVARKFAEGHADESTSLGNDAVEGDVRGIIFNNIKLKKGTHAIDINEVLNTLQYASEKEILLPAGTKLKITDFEKSEEYTLDGKKEYILIANAEIVE